MAISDPLLGSDQPGLSVDTRNGAIGRCRTIGELEAFMRLPMPREFAEHARLARSRLPKGLDCIHYAPDSARRADALYRLHWSGSPALLPDGRMVLVDVDFWTAEVRSARSVVRHPPSGIAHVSGRPCSCDACLEST